MEADQIIERLGLTPHPEGGYYRETWVAPSAGERASGTSILFLLKEGEASHWHRIDATEIWHFHAGAPLILETAASAIGPAVPLTLGPDVLAGHAPQGIVPPMFWQAARTTGKWTLVGCTVSPGFRFEGFELAPAGLKIPGG